MSAKVMLTLRVLKDLNRIGTRIKNNLNALLLSFPMKSRTITGMTNWLGVSRSTCQRIIECAKKSETGTDVIAMMPGSGGWQSFLSALKTHQVNAAELQRLDNLVNEFDQVLLQLGISHNALKKTITSASNRMNNSSRDIEERADLFTAASKVLGEQKEAKFCVCIVHIKPGDEKNVQIHTLTHLERCKISKQARPLFIPIWSAEIGADFTPPPTLSLERDLDQIAAEKIAFIDDYTSDHLNSKAIHISRTTDAIIIRPESTQSEPFDVTMYVNYERDQLRHLKGINHSNSIGMQVRNPCKQLYFIVFIEKGMAANSTPEAGAFAYRRTENTLVQGAPDDIWFDRFPGSLDVVQANPEINFSSKLNYIKANELINSLFNITKVDRTKYACYLLNVDYPIWSSEYRIFLTYDFHKKSDD